MNDEPMDWGQFFSSMSDQRLEEIMDIAHRERIKRDTKKFEGTLPGLNFDEATLLAEGKMIPAIKAYRQRTRVDLRSAKYAIDNHPRNP